MPLLDRRLSPPVLEALENFIASTEEKVEYPFQWAQFYIFVVAAYMVKREHRPSISQLNSILKEKGIKNSGTLAVNYGHALYALATYDEKGIYKKGFNP
ncbi:MAG: hypothetical protein S4CHLAM123_15610 [Chlamydiales bacterium]|nr:hypothetical protein [Chlamydiales bacterium]